MPLAGVHVCEALRLEGRDQAVHEVLYAHELIAELLGGLDDLCPSREETASRVPEDGHDEQRARQVVHVKQRLPQRMRRVQPDAEQPVAPHRDADAHHT